MTLTKLASMIAKREGKKSQARIGDIREILKILFTLDAEDSINDIEIEDGVRGVIDKEVNRIADRLYKKRTK
jgi:hypothetical protein